jgi:hypothetical protein
MQTVMPVEEEEKDDDDDFFFWVFSVVGIVGNKILFIFGN